MAVIKPKLRNTTYLAVALEDVAFKHVGSAISSYVREDLQIRAVVRHVEDTVDRMVHDLNAFGVLLLLATEENRARALQERHGRVKYYILKFCIT